MKRSPCAVCESEVPRSDCSVGCFELKKYQEYLDEMDNRTFHTDQDMIIYSLVDLLDTDIDQVPKVVTEGWYPTTPQIFYDKEA